MLLRNSELFSERTASWLAAYRVHLASVKRCNGVIDWYAILGIGDLSASAETIKRNYDNLARKISFNFNEATNGALKLISQAWHVLFEPSHREAYDRERGPAPPFTPRPYPDACTDACPRCGDRCPNYNDLSLQLVTCFGCNYEFAPVHPAPPPAPVLSGFHSPVNHLPRRTISYAMEAEECFLSGKYYKSWSILIANCDLFDDLLACLFALYRIHLASVKRCNGIMDWYAVLLVEDPLACKETIKHSYDNLAGRVHYVAKYSAAADGAFKLISQAWKVLAEPSQREAYDRERGPAPPFAPRICTGPCPLCPRCGDQYPNCYYPSPQLVTCISCHHEFAPKISGIHYIRSGGCNVHI